MSRYNLSFKILTNRFPFKWHGDHLNNLMKSIKDILSDVTTKINEVYDTRFITHAAGTELDKWGGVLDCSRSTGESDATYKARLLVAYRDIQETLVVEAYKDAIMATTGAEPECREHYSFIPRLICHSELDSESLSPIFSWPAHLYSYEHLLTASFVLSNLNHIHNSGFEQGDWGGPETQSAAQKYKGDYSAELISNGSAEVFSGLSNRISIDPAAYTYTVSVWANITSYTQGKYVLRAIFYNSSDTQLGTMDWKEFTAVTTGWEKSSYTFLPGDFPANTAKIDFQFAWILDGAVIPSGTAYIDNYKFEIADAATEDWTQTELATIATDLQNVKLATLRVWLTEDSGLNYYVLKEEIL